MMSTEFLLFLTFAPPNIPRNLSCLFANLLDILPLPFCADVIYGTPCVCFCDVPNVFCSLVGGFVNNQVNRKGPRPRRSRPLGALLPGPSSLGAVEASLACRVLRSSHALTCHALRTLPSLSPAAGARWPKGRRAAAAGLPHEQEFPIASSNAGVRSCVLHAIAPCPRSPWTFLQARARAWFRSVGEWANLGRKQRC